MAPSHSRQLLIWTLPTIAVLLSYLWYKRKRIGSKSDPGVSQAQTIHSSESETVSVPATAKSSPNKSFSRSLSGVDSAPIDIVIPHKLKSSKSNPVVISDEDLDLEIEKIRSMRFNGSIDLRNSCRPDETTSSTSSSSSSSSSKSATPSPARKENSFASTPLKTPPKMAQKVVVEEQLPVPKENCVKIEKSPANKRASDDLHRQNSERDSANHSPADVMLASPSLSSISDNHSEGSNDSGKGGSDVATPPPSRTPGAGSVGDAASMAVFEFIIPQTLVGKLIGKHGSFVSAIKDKTGSHVVVRKHPSNNKLKICAIEGNKKEIDSALKLIRDKFPVKRFPEVTLEQVSFLSQVPMVNLGSDHLYLKLIEGINNDTIVSCMVAPNHLFLQQPTHPTYPNLNLLSSIMNVVYAEADSPLLPTPIPENTVCAAYSVDSWFRAMVLSTDTESGTCYVKFLDYGGYAYVENSKLRQIRGDFMLLPFQAAECFLACVQPAGEASWPEQAYSFVAEITKGAIIYTQIADYTDDGVPLVYCYLVLGPDQIVFLNQELVNQGHAEWLSSGDEAAGVTPVA